MKDMRQDDPAMSSVQPTAVGPDTYSWMREYSGPITRKFTVEPTRAMLSCKNYY